MNAVSTMHPRIDLLHCYLLEAKLEFLRLLRTPAFALPTLLFPPMFYLLFGVMLGRSSPAGDIWSPGITSTPNRSATWV